MGKTKNAGGRKLVVLSGRTKGTAFVLTKPEINAGRESDNAICLKGKRVSRYHAVLVRTNGEYTLRDVSPHIGTLLNGRRTKEAALKPGDRIRIGEIEMSYEAETVAAPVMESSSETIPALPDEIAAPIIPVMAAHEEPVVENSTNEYQQRIAELTQETERLIDEAKRGNEALELVRAQLQSQSNLQADLSERLGAMSQENIAMAKRNSELQAKISEGEVSAEEACRMEGELTQEIKRLVGDVKQANEALESLHAQLRMQSDLQRDLMEQLNAMTKENVALAKRNDELQAKFSKLEASSAKTRESVKAEAPVPALPVSPAKVAEKKEPVQTAPIENHKTQEETVTKRIVSEQKTNEQFDKIRRTIVEKKNLKANMTFFERFMLPFRDTARLVVEEPVSTSTDPK
jgi:hypothetical protein